MGDRDTMIISNGKHSHERMSICLLEKRNDIRVSFLVAMVVWRVARVVLPKVNCR